MAASTRKGEEISPLMAELSAYIASAVRRKLPEEVSERARIHLLDTFAAVISGARLIPGKRAAAYVATHGAPKEAGVLGTRVVTSALYAALANGIAGHADETDEVHPPSRTHPGTSLVPATLAVAEREGLSGRDLLRAFVLGYDVCTRTMLALKQEAVRKTGQGNNAKSGLLGSGAAAAALLRLNAWQVRHVISYCVQQSAGLRTTLRDTEHIEKGFVNGGMPAHNGVASALMVQSGFTGVEDSLSGEPNFFSVFSPEADREAMVRGLGRDYEIMRAGIKYWPAGGPIQGPLHVLQDVILEHGLKPGDVQKLVARMPEHELKTVNNRDMPDICVQHLLAVMLLDGNVTFKSAHDYRRMKHPKVLELRKRIEAVGDPGLTDPLRRWRCVMEITLKDGRVINHQSMAAKGGVDNPLTREEAGDKARDLMAPVLGAKRTASLMAKLYEIERVKDVRELRKLYSA